MPGYRIIPMLLALVMLLGCARRDVNVIMMQACQAVQQGDLGEAEKLSAECLEINASNMQARLVNDYCRFCRQKREGDRKQALYDLLKCTILEPENFDCWYYYGWALVQSGKYSEGMSVLKRAYDLLPPKGGPRIRVQLLLGRCYAENNLQAKALSMLQALQLKKPYCDWPELYNMLGLLALRNRQAAAAVTFFRRGLEHSPGNDVLLRNLAVTYDVYLDDPVQARHFYVENMRRAGQRGDNEQVQALQRRLRVVARRIGN